MVNLGSIVTSAVAATSLFNIVTAHPGEKHDLAKVKRQIDARELRAAAAKRSLSNCQGSLKHRDLMQRSVARRAKALSELRQRRGISTNSKKYRRDLALLQQFEAINHDTTGTVDYTPNSLASDIFSANTSYILAPEVTGGPYYVTGEMIRKDVKEGQVGIDLYLEVQYVDITTCEPVPDLYVDIWNCNATGTYSGTESGQGGLNTTFLRGVQDTDEDGVVTFETIFPGHYEGRAVHTHLLTKSNVTVRENGTTGADGAVTHIGQLFWHEKLISAVEATEPYNQNFQSYTSNDADMWSIVQAENNYDPFPEFLYLGDNITDGLMAWIQIGINSTADYTNDSYYAVAADYQAGGGVANPNGFSGGNPSGNNTRPSGAMPNGGDPRGNSTRPSGAMPSGGIPSGNSPRPSGAMPSGAAPSAATSTA